MRIAIVADHNGTALAHVLTQQLRREGHEVEECSAIVDADGVVDYPPLCRDVCRRVVDGHAHRAIVVGGSGSGELIACNKIAGIRAGIGHDLFTAEISRAHNDANVLVLGAKVIDRELAARLVAVWLDTPFKGGRHQHRLDQIAALERGESLS